MNGTRIAKIGFTGIAVGSVSVILAHYAQSGRNSVSLLKFGVLTGVISVYLAFAGVMLMNLRPIGSGPLRGSRRRLLGLSLLILALPATRWLLSVTDSVTHGESLWSAGWPQIGEVIGWLLKPNPVQAQVTATIAALLCLSGSLRWLGLGLVSLFGSTLVATKLGEEQFALWLALGIAVIWLLGILFICPRCGGLFKYWTITSELLSQREVIVHTPRSSPISATVSDSWGRHRGSISGSSTTWVPEQRTQSSYRHTHRCNRCGYTASSVSSSTT